MTVRRSDDSGGSWPKTKLVWAGSAAYSVLVPINTTHIGLVFENGDAAYSERVSFVPLAKALD
jgi:hypothetical protein